MNHLVVYWAVLVGGSTLTGLAIVALLVSERSTEPLSAVSVSDGIPVVSLGVLPSS